MVLCSGFVIGSLVFGLSVWGPVMSGIIAPAQGLGGFALRMAFLPTLPVMLLSWIKFSPSMLGGIGEL
jgi:hypothetical protein